jgi:hypothetical protein
MSNAGSLMDLAYDAQFAEEEAAIKCVKNDLMLLAQDFAVCRGLLTPRCALIKYLYRHSLHLQSATHPLGS